MLRSFIFRRFQAQIQKLTTANTLTVGEEKLQQLLKKKFPNATLITVSDISGGCGAMYDIVIHSLEFKDKRLIQQHKLVTEALKEEIKDMHGLRINTEVPQSESR